jgi:hypothetical protein
LSFINSLQAHGLIEVNTISEKRFILLDTLPELEKFIHLHYDLEINMEGIEAISNLLNRMKTLQEEIAALKNKLHIYE